MRTEGESPLLLVKERTKFTGGTIGIRKVPLKQLKRSKDFEGVGLFDVSGLIKFDLDLRRDLTQFVITFSGHESGDGGRFKGNKTHGRRHPIMEVSKETLQV